MTTETSDIETLKARVEELQLELTEAQHAIQARDGELSRVSAECERASGEARAVRELAGTLRDLTGTGPASIATFFESFLESQAKLLAAQANALAIQSSPPLPSFTGEDVEVEENGFGRWLDRFEERATLLAWSDQQRVYQLRSHLTKTALQVFELLAPEQRASYSEAVAALQDRFKPVDIEELRGLEFHQLMQTEESVERLGLQLMALAKKAFPSLGARELDRLLKGRFFQALLPKWQRKLGAPKVAETFAELYGRARTCERHEQQYRASSHAKESAKPKQTTPKSSVAASSPEDPGPVQPDPPPQKRQSTVKCFQCGGFGHFKRNCPSRPDKSEALGRSYKPPEASTAAVGAHDKTRKREWKWNGTERNETTAHAQ